MRTITAATAFKMPLYGIGSMLSASSELLIEASKHPASVLCTLRRDKSKQAKRLVWSEATDRHTWRSQACNKGLLLSGLKNLLLVWSEATDRHTWRSQACNKGLLLSDQNFFGLPFHYFSDFQDIDFLCLEKLYQSNFTAAKSGNGSSRLFCF